MKSIYNNEYKIFIELLKEYRIKKNFTQNKLAAALGWSNHTYVSKYETLERRLDFIESINICKALGIPPKNFMEELEKRLKEIEK